MTDNRKPVMAKYLVLSSVNTEKSGNGSSYLPTLAFDGPYKYQIDQEIIDEAFEQWNKENQNCENGYQVVEIPIAFIQK